MTFPMDGPHSPDQTIEAANQAAELVRYINHVTRAGQDGLSDPQDAERLIAALHVLTGRLPQLCEQAEAFLYAQQSAGRLAHDDGDLDRHLTDFRFWIRDAASRSAEATRDLQQAQNAISGLYVKDDGDGD